MSSFEQSFDDAQHRADSEMDDPRARSSLEARHEREAFYGLTNEIARRRADRASCIGKARLCSTTRGRQTWVDLAREANLRLVAAKRSLTALNASLRFGPYRQVAVAPGVFRLAWADAS